MAGHLGANKDIEKLARSARKSGWDVFVTRGNHLRFNGPNGEVIIGSLSAGVTSVKKLSSQLRKAGIQ
jgi:predicted RNA binding protein YcfA (HicA-like mRNA interferase family)